MELIMASIHAKIEEEEEEEKEGRFGSEIIGAADRIANQNTTVTSGYLILTYYRKYWGFTAPKLTWTSKGKYLNTR